MKPQVVVVGSFVQDLSFSCERFPAPGETIVGRFSTGPGGKGSNQAVAAGRTGVPTCFIGAVGRDSFAEDARKFYKLEGIGAHFVPRPPHATATASIVVNRSGQNQIVVALGASAHLRPGDIPAALVREARVAVCQHEANLPINTHVFRLARRAGATTILNPAPMRPDFDRAILALTDVLIPNETEFVSIARLLPATSALVREKPYINFGDFTEATLPALASDDLQRLCRALGVPTVIVTLGSRGCFVSLDAGGTFVPSHSVEAVDTTGAGDAFVGGFAAGLVKFRGDVVSAARFANAIAALSVTKPGTAPSMPRKGEIARFLRGR